MVHEIKEKVRYLRKKQTKTEAILWSELRNRKLAGYRFIRQYPITFNFNGKSKLFIADFYCAKSKLIIEVDGQIHDNQKEYDEFRTFIINTKGINVVRFNNEDIQNNLKNVLIKISTLLEGPSFLHKQKRGVAVGQGELC
ncbi:MAG: endonuclease domain-containing protein [Candidatus Margulisbacteria bacterium]|nr:endonuclease domain-containing protein [Candidatus Margulisiibacteriota bacterium]